MVWRHVPDGHFGKVNKSVTWKKQKRALDKKSRLPVLMSTIEKQNKTLCDANEAKTHLQCTVFGLSTREQWPFRKRLSVSLNNFTLLKSECTIDLP